MKKKILVIDQIDNEVLERTLQKEYQIINALDKEDAYEILSKDSSDISAVFINLEKSDQNFLEIEKTEPKFQMYDELTGLCTKEWFLKEASCRIKHQEAGYFMMSCMNIAHFKVINEQYGMEKGDEVLQYAAALIQECMLMIDGIACRTMADKFIVLYPAKYQESEIIVKTHRRIMNPLCIDRYIQLRVGRYLIENPYMDINAIYNRAVLSEESVKNLFDTNISVYNESMMEKLQDEQKIIGEMKYILSNQQLEIQYQPQFNQRTGALIGAEALVRWLHPIRGMLYPKDFIPAFERNGFIYEIDKYVWEQACILLREMLDAGKPVVPISVNISRYDVYRDDFIEVILKLIEKYQLKASLFRMEITETSFTGSIEQLIAIGNKLKKLGFCLEIDDFGRGYSSINMLRDVPTDILKLDMFFLKSDSNVEKGGNIVSSIVRMARWLGMAVIAEGVETEEQAEFLRSIGCYYVQGYLYSKPLFKKDFLELLVNKKREERLITIETLGTYNNDAFWNPQSLETLVFNHFSGGAFIFEYQLGSCKMLRANVEFGKSLRASLTEEEILNVDLFSGIPSEDRKLVEKTIKKTIKCGTAESCRVYSETYTEKGKGEYLLLHMRRIASSGDRYLIYGYVENITDLHYAEQEKDIINERLKAIMDNVNCGIAAVTLKGKEGTFLFANDKYYELLGYSKEQYLEQVKDNDSVFYPEDRVLLAEQIQKAKETREDTFVKFRVMLPDGKLRWLKALISIAEFSGIDVPVQLTITTDITEEREAHEQVNFLNSVARELINQSEPELGIKTILNRTMDYFNGDQAFIYEFNLESQTVQLTYFIRTDHKIIKKERASGILISETPFADYDTEKKYIEIEDIDMLEDSKVRTLLKKAGVHSFVAVPLYRDKKIIGFAGVNNFRREHIKMARLVALGDYIVMLLTRRDLNQKIKEENQEIVTIMNGIPGGFARLQVMPDARIMPLYYSDGLLEILEVTRKKAQKIYLKIWENNAIAGVHPEDVPVVFQAIDQMMQDGEVHSSRYRMLNGKGEYIWLMFFGKMRISNSGSKYLNLYFLDEKVETDLVEAREASKAKSSYLSRVSHDVRTPLNSVLNFARFIEDAQTLEEAKDLGRNVVYAGNYMHTLLNDTLDISRIETGKIELKLEPCRYEDFELTVKNVLADKAEKKGIRLNFVRPAQESMWVMLDKTRVEQIIINIVNNAVKFTQEGGEITVITELLNQTAEGEWIRCTISDTGIGISEEFLPHIFEAFRQEERKSQNTEIGSGLGLVIAKELVELMRGTISVKSTLGKGTTFVVELPAVASKGQVVKERKDKEKKEIINLRGKRVLVCEDHPMNQDIMIRCLKKTECDIEIAENGEEGLEKYKNCGDAPFQIIFMDIHMPVMDGYEATKRIRMMEKDGEKLPIVAMTADAFEEDVKKCKDAGMDDHLTKPISPRRLYEILEERIL